VIIPVDGTQKGLSAMIYRGVVKGKVIELEEPLPYPEGQSVSIWVEISNGEIHSGSPSALRRVMHEPPHLRCEDVDELERLIEEGKIPMRHESVFDEER